LEFIYLMGDYTLRCLVDAGGSHIFIFSHLSFQSKICYYFVICFSQPAFHQLPTRWSPVTTRKHMYQPTFYHIVWLVRDTHNL
jgi:hypothetical protein